MLSSRGIAATVVGDAVVCLLPRRQPASDGSHHVNFLQCRIRSLADLGVLLGDAGSEIFWQEALAEMEAATAVATREAGSQGFNWRRERLLPQFSTRAIVCGMATFLLGTAAYEDIMSPKPRAAFGMFSVALFFLWHAYQRPTAVQPGSHAATGPARLYSLSSAVIFLAMVMLLGHSCDGFLFGGDQHPVNSMAVFVLGIVLLVFLRTAEQRIDPESWPSHGGFFGMPLRSGEAALAASGFIWLVVLALMPPHRPIFEHGFAPSVAETRVAGPEQRR